PHEQRHPRGWRCCFSVLLFGVRRFIAAFVLFAAFAAQQTRRKRRSSGRTPNRPLECGDLSPLFSFSSIRTAKDKARTKQSHGKGKTEKQKTKAARNRRTPKSRHTPVEWRDTFKTPPRRWPPGRNRKRRGRTRRGPPSRYSHWLAGTGRSRARRCGRHGR